MLTIVTILATGVCELFQIWGSLTDHANREKVLAFAHSVASERSRSARP